MEFGGPKPPMNDEYLKSSFSEALWKDIEDNNIDCTDDLRGWKMTMEQEKGQIEYLTNRMQPELELWYGTIKWNINELVKTEGHKAAEELLEKIEQQRIYMEKVHARRNILEIRINTISRMILTNYFTEQQTKDQSNEEPDNETEQNKTKVCILK